MLRGMDSRQSATKQVVEPSLLSNIIQNANIYKDESTWIGSVCVPRTGSAKETLVKKPPTHGSLLHQVSEVS